MPSTDEDPYQLQAIVIAAMIITNRWRMRRER
jgi:hypothetical protein